MFKFPAVRKAITNVTVPPKAFPFGIDVTAAKLESIRNDPAFRELLAEIRQAAQEASQTPIETLPFSMYKLFDETGERHRFERLYFNRRKRVSALALAAFLDKTDAYTEALENMIWSICDECTWSLPAHINIGVMKRGGYPVPPQQVVDLFAAETAHTLSEIRYMLGEKLHPKVHERIGGEVEKRVLEPLFHHPVAFIWETKDNNWSAVCAGAAGMAALLTVKDGERLAGIVDRVLRAMESFMDGYGEDGACPEGISYWTYGFGYFAYFADMLSAYTSGELDALQGDKVRRIAEFPAGIAFGGTSFVSFSDAPLNVRLQTGLISRLHERTGSGLPEMLAVTSFDSDHCYRFAHLRSSLLWTKPELLYRQTGAGRYYFNDLAWLIDRHDAGGGLISFAAKGGHNEEPHNHNDVGQFLLNLDGESLITDLGAGVYDRDYFGDKRYTYLHNASEGHCVPVVNGQPQLPGRKRAAKVAEVGEREGASFFELDITKAYGDEAGLERFTRRFDWKRGNDSKEPVLELADTFEFRGGQRGNAVNEHLISLTEPRYPARGEVEWTGRKGSVRLAYDASLWTVSHETIETKGHLQEPQTVYRLVLAAYTTDDRIAGRFRFVCRLHA